MLYRRSPSALGSWGTAVILLLALLLPPALLENTARADEVELEGGTRLTGVVLEKDDEHVRLLLPKGSELEIATADVAAIHPTEGAPKGGEYLRFVEGKDADTLDTAIVHLVRDEPYLRVDLVGVTHLADASYYREIQTLLEVADVVLYEAVKPKDESIEERREATGDEGLMRLQTRLAEFLGLTFQIDGIRYDRPHFVHADLTLEEFQDLSNEDGGKDAPAELEQAQRIAKLMGPLIDLLAKLGDRMPALQRATKRALGRVLAEMGANLEDALPEHLVTLLLDRRNAVVMQRLAEVDAATRSVAVLYGAAHLKDLEHRLEQAGFRRVGARWLTAWRIAE